MGIAIFVFLACGSALTGFLTIYCRKPAHSALYLAASSICVGLLCILLAAPFIAFAHLLICAVGIALLGIFICVVLNLENERDKGIFRVFSAIVAGGAVLGVMGFFLWRWRLMAGEQIADATTSLSELIFAEFLLPVELGAFLLLVALLGSVLLTRREEKTMESGSR